MSILAKAVTHLLTDIPLKKQTKENYSPPTGLQRPTLSAPT
jgi:hypothetical protein